ncbi:hypothetical protein BVRB_013420 isoform B [Beta vulgaris subsp. vulgaris]|uniref:Biogenesis of lysosome-related organelles complex 1 subunit 7 n=1 Tax=Beta vulgaris subsp. vulgaris TaxID=3555 RepID=A0A0J8B578_BETVV|nr:uncharacterized protein LOC104884967 isoform X2 [Beta vulgaris subsp. vulgaris]XP_010667979.1 uncharacterized protein LOC104884967 isoform X2 [Beta vulgaris subsp. vulgaris]KMS94992.1 hypothetical protein BVRB_013420 isoform B [Beta vulgaris subsp. vulgaris]
MSNSSTNAVGIAKDDSNSTNSAQLVNNVNHIHDNITGNPKALAEGISTMLADVIKGFDSKAEAASTSQHTLFSALDRLTAELDQLLEDAPLPFIMQHATKLSNVRRRVASLNSLLKSVQHRLDNIDRMMSIGSIDNKSNKGGSK